MEEAHSNNIERDSCPIGTDQQMLRLRLALNISIVWMSSWLCLLECLPDRRLTLCPFTTDNAVVYLLCAMLLVSGFEAPRHAKCD